MDDANMVIGRETKLRWSQEGPRCDFHHSFRASWYLVHTAEKKFQKLQRLQRDPKARSIYMNGTVVLCCAAKKQPIYTLAKCTQKLSVHITSLPS